MQTLIEKLKAADAGSRELDAEVAKALGYRNFPNSCWWRAPNNETCEVVEIPCHTTSIDAALTLVPEGWNRKRLVFGDTNGLYEFALGQRDCDINEIITGEADSPALAICIAALMARETENERD